jgi:diguanylate cyclase (GGDEF)-like protein
VQGSVDQETRHLVRHVSLLLENRKIEHELQDQLGFFGFSVDRVDALRQLSRLRFSGRRVLLVDAGYLHRDAQFGAALQRLKTVHREQLYVVVLSDWDNFAVRLTAVRAGGDAFFSSPIDIPRLIDKIDALSGDHGDDPYHILLVSARRDELAHQALSLQRAGMITSAVSEPEQLFPVLFESKPELILIDMEMPDCNGLELARLIRQQESFIGVPIVFLSDDTDEASELAAMREGADDFLLKPVDMQMLVSAVATRAKRTRNLRFFMERDSLTGLLNHSNLKEKLGGELHRAERVGSELSFAMLDLDHFKSVNDTYGHLTGDRVLKSLARLLNERLRKSDVIGRYGGEEFGVILVDAGEEEAAHTLEEIRASFSRIRQHLDGHVFYATFSCGISSYPDVSTVTELNEEADRALYRAKALGRNRVVRAGAGDTAAYS